ncbi:MAG: hypothetical protein LBJ20_00870 [Candidatus Methanoplasma sp.]|jgi:hypothetical protein|nr:hypothetical protein [Candidatus Methanoplasma sp.]
MIKDDLLSMKHGVIIVVGSGKTGKSTLLFSLSDRFFSDRPRYILETYDFDNSLFPGYSVVKTVWDVPPGSLLVVEDVGRLFPARGSQKQAALSGWVSLISHKDIVVLLSVQSTAILDIDFFRTQRVILLHKLVWDVDLRFEREELRPLQVTANLRIRKAIASRPGYDQRSFSYCADNDEIVIMDPPAWWIHGIHSHYLRNSVPDRREGTV